MTDDIVIRVEGLGKKYIIGHQAERERYVALRDVLARGVHGIWCKAADMARGRIIVPGDEVEEFWALGDVNFEVKRGEVLGIIGRNGAGKSTLLKILSRITEPSEGRVTIHGRVASLLEVGTGFHPELTGRENIYLNGAILGMTHAEIKRKFDEIVVFAEVEKFLDTPVKRYSSGMYVRLAFAVAAHLEPEILVVDEVLAVGDAEFQKKCLGKIQDVAGHGRTVLFVSHNMAAVNNLCQRAVWLENGHIVGDGSTQSIVERYLVKTDSTFIEQKASDQNAPVVLRALSIGDANGSETGVDQGQDIAIEVRYEVKEILRGLSICIRVITEGGGVLFQSPDSNRNIKTIRQSGTYISSTKIPGHLLREGTYLVGISADIPFERVIFDYDAVARFTVVGSSETYRRAGEAWPGVIAPNLRWRVERVHSRSSEGMAS